MPQSFHDQSGNGDPSPAEIFRVFRSATMASIEGLRLLLDECADLRAELITIHGLHSDGDGDGLFSARQQSRTVELRGAAENMEALIASLPRKASDGQDGMDTQKSG